mmetsp:Transcript_36885/g.98000  ORF Transcript_36885/g.98000 Transcript_36885/m.98000 type:complete len:220 (-) Transcript_36885:653-1312(-)
MRLHPRNLPFAGAARDNDQAAVESPVHRVLGRCGREGERGGGPCGGRAGRALVGDDDAAARGGRCPKGCAHREGASGARVGRDDSRLARAGAVNDGHGAANVVAVDGACRRRQGRNRGGGDGRDCPGEAVDSHRAGPEHPPGHIELGEDGLVVVLPHTDLDHLGRHGSVGIAVGGRHLADYHRCRSSCRRCGGAAHATNGVDLRGDVHPAVAPMHPRQP